MNLQQWFMPTIPPEIRYTMLEQDRRKKVRQFMPYKDAKNTAKLREILTKHQEITDRAVAALFLGFIGGSAEISTLQEVLKSPGKYPNKWASEYVQLWAAVALGLQGKDDGINHLEQLLKHPYAATLREARRYMCHALHRINTPRSLELLKIAAKDKDSHISKLAQQLLGTGS